MTMFRSFKNFFSRHNFDYDHPSLDLYKFHPQLRILLASNGVFFNNTESKLRFLYSFVSSSLAISALVLGGITIYHELSERNFAVTTETFYFFILTFTIPIINTTVIINKTKLINLLERMNGDFKYICILEYKYKAQFLRGQLYIWQLCYVWFIFSSLIGCVFVATTVVTLTYQSLFATQDENTERPLEFPMWLPNDAQYRTPSYEMVLIFQTTLCFNFVQSFCVFIYVLFHTLLHYYYLLSMIFLDFETIFDGLDESVVQLSQYDSRRIAVQMTLKRRMKRIVNWHISVFRSVKIISSVYGPPLVFQVMFSSIAICLMAYQIAENLDHGKIHFLFILFCIATCVQLWIPCYLGTLLRNQAFEVGEACWRCGWHQTSLGSLLRSDIIIFIIRAQQPLNIEFIGLPKLELETFSSIMNTSYSYFNFLRRYK